MERTADGGRKAMENSWFDGTVWNTVSTAVHYRGWKRKNSPSARAISVAEWTRPRFSQ